MDWKALPIQVLDFEGQRSYGVVEYGWVTLYAGSIAGTQTRLCQARGSIPFQDTQVHGLKREQLQNLKPFAQDYEIFCTLRNEGFLAAHHAPTEQGLMAATWPYPKSAPSFIERSFDFGWGPWVDSCKLYRKIFPQIKNYQLAHLVKTFKLQERLDTLAAQYCPADRRHYHCALYDALACALLLLHLGTLDGFESLTLDWLLEHCGYGPEQRLLL